MPITFDRPVGSPADLKELEYISALHQTCLPKLRQDASISVTDVMYLLRSRHGLLANPDICRQSILVDLAGEFHPDEPLFQLDLVQVVALLLIPHFLKNGIDGKALEQVLLVLTSEVQSPILNREFLKQVLDFHLEVNVSNKTLDDMISAAGGEGTKLDTASLLHALTSDVTLYHAEWTDRLSTHYQDVFSSFDQDKPVEQENAGTEDEEQVATDNTSIAHPTVREETIMDGLKQEISKHRSIHDSDNDGVDEPMLRKIWTASSIDSVADTYSSQTFTAILWASFIVVYLAYFWKYKLSWGSIPCDGGFGCTIVNGITSWLVTFVELSFFGMLYIFLGSAGNSISDNKVVAVVRLLTGMTTILFVTVLSLFFVIDTEVVSTVKQDRLLVAYVGAALMGAVLLILQFIAFLGEFFSLEFLKKHAIMEAILTPGMEKMERRTKLAAQFKVKKMVDNALEFHAGRQSAKMSQDFKMTARGAALLNYQSREEKTERIGGMCWAWKRVWNNTIFEEEGVWLHARLVSSTIAQGFVLLFLIAFMAISILSLLQKYSSGNTNPDEQPAADVTVTVNSTGEPIVYVWEAAVAGTAGLLAGVTGVVTITLTYIPSFITSCLKFRSGVFPSLRDRDFRMYRVAVDLVTTLYGAAFWGVITTGLFTTLLVGGVVFVAVWHVTRSFMIVIIAQLIGITVTLLVKQVVLIFLRKQFRAAFYRKMPLKDNFTNTLLECWNIGLSSGIMLMRALKLLFVTVCYLGRLDTPLLADGVGFIGPIQLDSFPISFRKDLLQHDAHRHPYLERLATMYMMKLRYGEDFGNRANSLWRVLFVLCLMPWMRKYRLRPLPTIEDLDDQIEEAQAELAAAADDEGEDGGAIAPLPDRTLQRAATQRRLESMQNLKSLRTIGTGANREELLEKELTILRERNRQLLAQVKQLGGNPAASRRNLMLSITNNDNLAMAGAFPDRRSGNGATDTTSATSPLSLIHEESTETNDQEVEYKDASDEYTQSMRKEIRKQEIGALQLTNNLEDGEEKKCIIS